MDKTLFTLCITLVTSLFVQAQEEVYKKVAKLNQIEYLPSTLSDLQSETFNGYISDMNSLKSEAEKKEDTVYYNNAVLNKYFSDLITNYANSTGDLSFSKYTINANSSDKTLTIGGAFRFDNFYRNSEKRKALKSLRPLRKTGNLLYLYVKSGLNDGFSSIYSKNDGEYGFNSDIGIGAKYTHIFNGHINEGKIEKIEYVRNSIVKKEVTKKIQEYKKSNFESDLRLKNIMANAEDDPSKQEKNKNELLQQKHREFYEMIVDKELEMMRSKQLFTSAGVTWASFEFYIPIKGQQINSTLDTLTTTSEYFNNWNAKITGNYLRNKNYTCFLKKSSFKFTGELSFLNTNNFAANSQSAVSFQNIIQDNITNQVEGTSTSVFIGDYNEFVTSFFRSEISTLTFNNTVGLSAAYEVALFGDVINRNWKLGIPFSLKDKDEKPTVNFELQWREINKAHTIGISVGYNFGKFIK